jgi:hypothetical protein
MNARLSCAAALALVLIAWSTRAAAREPRAGTTPDADGYGYVFGDDVLAAGGLSPSDARIHVVPHAARSTLIRPRTAFIRELLASVENI